MLAPKIKFPCPVLRVRAEWENEEVRIQKVVRIPRMTLLRTLKIPNDVRNHSISGLWYELVDAKDQLQLRKIIGDPRKMEIVNEDGSFSITSIRTDKISFDILIPEIEGAGKLQFFVQEKPKTEKTKPVAVYTIQELKSYEKGDDNKNGK